MKKLLLFVIIALGLTTASRAQSFFEGFEGAVVPTGWDTLNLSGPNPGIAWFPSNYFSSCPPPAEGSEYFCAGWQAEGFCDTISSWLFTPVALLNNGDQFMFYTTTILHSGWRPDRMEVRLSGAGAGTNVGTGPNTVGTYTMLLAVINPSLNIFDYPKTFTKYQYTLSGLPAGGVSGRFAFRYFVDDLFYNAYAIGVDSVYYKPLGTGISSAVNNGVFKVFPNPTNGPVKMNFKTASDVREVIVQNLTGQILFRE